jgi:hypothetical protein
MTGSSRCADPVNTKTRPNNRPSYLKIEAGSDGSPVGRTSRYVARSSTATWPGGASRSSLSNTRAASRWGCAKPAADMRYMRHSVSSTHQTNPGRGSPTRRTTSSEMTHRPIPSSNCGVALGGGWQQSSGRRGLHVDTSIAHSQYLQSEIRARVQRRDRKVGRELETAPGGTAVAVYAPIRW